jgi:aminodeoxychorismate lyase
MLVFLNGKFVPEAEALVSVFDRSFLYGDGLFETIRVSHGVPFRWPQHLERLRQGSEFLKIAVPFGFEELRGFAERLIAENGLAEAILRLGLSRGKGVRGYSPKGADHPFLVMTLHPAPESDPQQPARWHLVTSSIRLLANERLSSLKTCNKLAQIMARTEADALNAQEAILLNTDGYVVEGASSNLFWIDKNTVVTPPLASGILPGITRSVIFELCDRLKVPCREANITPDRIVSCDGILLSLASLGVVEAIRLDDQPLRQSPVTAQLIEAYRALVDSETRAQCR